MNVTRRGIFGVIAAAVLGREVIAKPEPLYSWSGCATATNAPPDWTIKTASWAQLTPDEILADIKTYWDHEKRLWELPCESFDVVIPQRAYVGCYTGDGDYYERDGNGSIIV